MGGVYVDAPPPPADHVSFGAPARRGLMKQKKKTKKNKKKIFDCLRTNHNHRCVVCTYISSVSIDTSSQAPIFTRQIRLPSPSWPPC